MCLGSRGIRAASPAPSRSTWVGGSVRTKMEKVWDRGRVEQI